MMLSVVLASVIVQSGSRMGKALPVVSGSGQKLLGAKEVIRQMRIPLPGKLTDPIKVIEAEASVLRSKLPTLAPKAAAEAFLGLVRDWEARVPEARVSYERVRGWSPVMSALPDPAAWPLIRKGLERLPALRTRPVIALFDDLLGNDDAVLKFMESRAADSNAADDDPFGEIQKAEIGIATRAGRFDLLEKIYLRVARENSVFSGGIPDLVRLMGRKRAGSLIRAILETSPSSCTFRGSETRRLAREMVQSDLSHLKSAQWDLVEGLGDFPFVAAQVAKFGEESLGQTQAAFVYALGLAKKGELDEAIRLLSTGNQPWSWAWSTSTAADEAERTETYSLLGRILERKQVFTLVSMYVRLGQSLGRSDEAYKRLEDWLSQTDLDVSARQLYLSEKASLDSAAGKNSLAVSEYEEAIRLNPQSNYETGQLASHLLDIAVVLHDNAALDFLATTSQTMGTRGANLDFFNAYDRMGRIEDAALWAVTAMSDVNNVNLAAEGQGRLKEAYPGTGAQLAEVYYKANQPEQIVILLHEYPKWGAVDLGEILTSTRRGYAYWSGSPQESLGFYAAWALAKTGQKDVAVRILRALISTDPSEDAAYKLLNELEGEGALSVYRDLTQAMPSEARPLIWKADLLLRMGRLKDAEKTVREAMSVASINPYAERGNGRVAYEVLGRIAKAEGDIGLAAECEKTVEAAGLCDEAARNENAGLTTAAASLYERAIAISPNDWAARLGYSQVLNLLHRKQEALDQYRKAFELTSMGADRETATELTFYAEFDMEGALAIAKEVLGRRLREHPRNSALLTAFGQVLEKEGDHLGALQRFEEAIRIDRRCVQAWRGIVDLIGEGVVSRAQTKEAVLALIRLVPGQRYYSFSERFGQGPSAIELCGDYAAFYRAYRESPQPLPRAVGQLFALETSRRSLASGARPANEGQVAPGPVSPGAELADIGELRALFP